MHIMRSISYRLPSSMPFKWSRNATQFDFTTWPDTAQCKRRKSIQPNQMKQQWVLDKCRERRNAEHTRRAHKTEHNLMILISDASLFTHYIGTSRSPLTTRTWWWELSKLAQTNYTHRHLHPFTHTHRNRLSTLYFIYNIVCAINIHFVDLLASHIIYKHNVR